MSCQIIAEETRTARKGHRCAWCGQAILAGERYKHVRFVFEGEPGSNDWHPECDSAADQSCAAAGEAIQFEPGAQQRGQVMAEA